MHAQAGSEQLTLLGRHLAALPLPPRIGKMLLYGALFNCLDPVLTVTCAMAYRCLASLEEVLRISRNLKISPSAAVN